MHLFGLLLAVVGLAMIVSRGILYPNSDALRATSKFFKNFLIYAGSALAALGILLQMVVESPHAWLRAR